MEEIALVIEVTPAIEGRGATVAGLLTCGHYGSPVHEASSTWDFPGDEHRCPTCGSLRQFDLRLQVAIVNGWDTPS